MEKCCQAESCTVLYITLCTAFNHILESFNRFFIALDVIKCLEQIKWQRVRGKHSSPYIFVVAFLVIFITDYSPGNLYWLTLATLYRVAVTSYGNSEIGAHERSNFCYLIRLRHLIRSRSVTNRVVMLRKDLFYHMSS